MVEGTEGGDRERSGGTTAAEREDLLARNRARRAQLREDAASAEPNDSQSNDSQSDGVEPASESPVDPQTRTGGGRLIPLLAGLAAIFAIATVVLTILLVTADPAADTAAADRQAVDDAKTYATTVLTYHSGDYAELDKRIRQISTAEFADRYIKSSQQAREGNDAAEATGTAEAKEAGLISRSDDRAVVLVAIDQNVRSPRMPAVSEGIDYQSRVKITLTRDGDDWKLSDLTVV
ncbi:hypothetical protein [Gordonia sp. (in: high G+C Gram-positive bacteria)]|uniref:hypothetical protein n=1 Tax=Gordonia sp. (in: high G+C Gram-positive bacteria) TaxID=84139 RepID=UPI003C779EE5